MYRLIVESLLGVTLDNGRLFIAPCIPADWKGFTMRYRYRGTPYEIAVEQSPPARTRVSLPSPFTLDGVARRAARCRSSTTGRRIACASSCARRQRARLRSPPLTRGSRCASAPTPRR
jgi:hypothetical protein